MKTIEREKVPKTQVFMMHTTGIGYLNPTLGVHITHCVFCVLRKGMTKNADKGTRGNGAS